MTTILDKAFRDSFGTCSSPTPEETEHTNKARAHFLKYCDSNKCIRGRDHSMKSNWHDNGFCLECAFNPYNMKEGTNNA